MTSRIKIGDKLYKYISFGNFAHYTVTAEIKRKKSILYEVRCESCDHGGEKCEMIVTKVRGEDYYSFVSISNDEEDQYYYEHTTHKKGEMFYPVLQEAKIAKYKEVIQHKKDDIKKHEDIAERLGKELGEIEAHYNNVRNETGETE